MYDCKNCKKPCINKARSKMDIIFGAPCDGCKLIFCKQCANLSTTEADAVALSHRNLVFFCRDCKLQLQDLPTIQGIIKCLDTQKLKCTEKDAQIEELQNKLKETTNDRQSQIDKLLTENAQQMVHIRRLRRRTEDFEDIALTNDRENNLKIESQVQEIQRLNSDIIQLLDSINNQTTFITELKCKIHTLEVHSKDLEVQKQNSSSQIAALTEDKDTLLNDLKKAKFELKKMSAENHESIHTISLYVSKLEKQEGLVNVLKEEINKQVFLNKAEEKAHQDLKVELNEFQTQCREMVSSIRILESENNRLLAELAKIKRDISEIGSEGVSHHGIEGKFTNTNSRWQGVFSPKRLQKSRNLLFLSDDYGKQVHRSLSDTINNMRDFKEFNLQHITKPGAGLINVIENIHNLAKDFTDGDYVLIMAGSNDFLRCKNPSVKKILDRIESCSHTNFIVFSVPYFQSRFNYKTNLAISRYNSTLKYLIERYNSKSENIVHFVDFHSTKRIKSSLRKISDVVLNLVSSHNAFEQKNLKYVKTTILSGESRKGNAISNQHTSPSKEVQHVNEVCETVAGLANSSFLELSLH